jgi:hypothetical protein
VWLEEVVLDSLASATGVFVGEMDVYRNLTNFFLFPLEGISFRDAK